MQVEIKGKNLVVTIPMEETRSASASGKTLGVASTRGNVKTGVIDPVSKKEITLGLNAYVKAED